MLLSEATSHPAILRPEALHTLLHLFQQDQGGLYLLLVERRHARIAVGKFVDHQLLVLAELADDGDQFTQTLLGMETGDLLQNVTRKLVSGGVALQCQLVDLLHQIIRDVNLASRLTQVDRLPIIQQTIDEGAGLLVRSNTEYLAHFEQESLKAAADHRTNVVQRQLAAVESLLDAGRTLHPGIVVEMRPTGIEIEIGKKPMLQATALLGNIIEDVVEPKVVRHQDHLHVVELRQQVMDQKTAVGRIQTGHHIIHHQQPPQTITPGMHQPDDH